MVQFLLDCFSCFPISFPYRNRNRPFPFLFFDTLPTLKTAYRFKILLLTIPYGRKIFRPYSCYTAINQPAIVTSNTHSLLFLTQPTGGAAPTIQRFNNSTTFLLNSGLFIVNKPRPPEHCPALCCFFTRRNNGFSGNEGIVQNSPDKPRPCKVCSSQISFCKIGIVQIGV